MKSFIINTLYSLYSLLRIVCYANLSSYKQFEKVSSNKVLRILGNGKSLNDIRLETDCDIDYMVVNRHVLADNYIQLKPCHYVLADPHFFVHPEGLDILKAINLKTSWNITLYIPNTKQTKESITQHLTNKHIRVVYYNMIPFKGFKSIQYELFKKQLSMPVVQNVLVASIMIGIISEYQNIELYGVEHTWTKYLYVDNQNVVYLENPHFFDKKQVNAKPVKDIQHTEEYPFYLILENYARMFKSYWEIKEFTISEKINVSIINKSKGSFIDAFIKQ